MRGRLRPLAFHLRDGGLPPVAEHLDGITHRCLLRDRDRDEDAPRSDNLPVLTAFQVRGRCAQEGGGYKGGVLP